MRASEKICLMVVLLFVGCSSIQNSARLDPLEDQTLSQYLDISSLTINDFEGPFAETFLQYTLSSKDPFITKIFSDSKVTTDELEESKQRFRSCFTNMGYDVTFETWGGYNVIPPAGSSWDDPATNNDENYCNIHFDFTPVEVVYKLILSNPNNVPTVQAIVQCLIRHNLVPKDYTVDDFNYEQTNSTGLLNKLLVEQSEGMRKFLECQDDPFGLLSPTQTQ